MAATLLSANRSILSQEASRAFRKAIEVSMWNLHKLSKGLTRQPRMGWVNFQFLGKEGVFVDIIDSLKQPYWDKNKMKNVVASLENTNYHSFSDMLMKIATIDYCLSLDD